LKDLLTAFVKSVGRSAGVIAASVAIIPNSVAILGWIIPAPLVIPAILYSMDGEEGRENVREISFGKVSVVQIACAAVSQWSCELPRASNAAGIPCKIFRIGNLGTQVSGCQ
jgi:hypothetical protein